MTAPTFATRGSDRVFELRLLVLPRPARWIHNGDNNSCPISDKGDITCQKSSEICNQYLGARRGGGCDHTAHRSPTIQPRLS